MWGILLCLALLRPPLLQRVTPFCQRCAAPSSALQFAREISQDAPCLIEHIDAVSKDPEVLESLEEYYRRVLEDTDYLRPSAQASA